MILKYNVEFSVSMYNRSFAKNKLSSKKISLVIGMDTPDPEYSKLLKSHADKIKSVFNNSIVVHVNDPIMVDLLEPKSGNTVHNRLNELKATITSEPMVLGTTVPPETKNGFKLIVFPEVDDVTLEGIADFIKSGYGLSSVVITDGSLTVEL